MIQYLQDNHIQPGVIALAPFFLFTANFSDGLIISLISILLLSILCLLFFNIKTLISHQHKLIMVLIISTSVFVTIRMLLNSEIYYLVNNLDVIFPLIILNIWSLSICEKAFSISSYKLLSSTLITFGLTLIVFLCIYGFIRNLLIDFSIFTSPAGCLILAGFIIAVFNMVKNKYSLN